MNGRFLCLALALLLIWTQSTRVDAQYAWRISGRENSASTIGHIPPPPGFERVQLTDGDFADWIRNLPLKPAGTIASLYNGESVPGQDYIHRIIDIDVGSRDLMQCADSVIRLRAEFFYSRGDWDRIAFNFTSGDRSRFTDWILGSRPIVNGNRVTWRPTAPPDSSYQALRDYLDNLFIYAGTFSLERELIPVSSFEGMSGGDLFIRGGFPGHVVAVADVSRNPRTGQTAVLLLQGFMPAMDVHVLSNLHDPEPSPWFIVTEEEPLIVHWGRFRASDLMRFAD